MSRRIVLTGPARSGQLLLAFPLDRARRDLTTYSTLLHAATFGAVRADERAQALVNTALESWAQRLQDEDMDLVDLTVEDVLALTARDGDLFPDAEEFFGYDWHAWRPEPRLLTADWLQEAAPEVLRLLGRPDEGWGFDYEPSLSIAVEDRLRLRGLLEQRGYGVVEADDNLAAAYDDPPRNVPPWLDAAVQRWTGQKPSTAGGDQ